MSTEPATTAIAAHGASPAVATASWHAFTGESFDAPCDACGLRSTDDHHYCRYDRCRRLTGRQKAYANDVCRARAWDAIHPRVNVPGIGAYRQAGSITDRLHGLMQDGKWRTIQQMSLDLHEVAETVAASLRRLKGRMVKLGVKQPIEKRLTPGPCGGTQAPREYRLAGYGQAAA